MSWMTLKFTHIVFAGRSCTLSLTAADAATSHAYHMSQRLQLLFYAKTVGTMDYSRDANIFSGC